MNNHYNTYANQNMENMYPEIYKHIYPIITATADDIRRNGHRITHEMLGNSVDHIIKLSGMWDEDGAIDEPLYDDALPVSGRGHGGRNFHRGVRVRGRRGPHNRNTLRDLVNILLLRELFF